MTVELNEIPYDAFKDLNDIFQSNKDFVSDIRKQFHDNCIGAAEKLKEVFNQNGILAEIIAFKNGHAFADGGITVFDNVYTHHAVVLLGDGIIDVLHTDEIWKTKDYIERLEQDNPKLKIFEPISTGWYTEDGYLYMPSLKDLKDYKY